MGVIYFVYFSFKVPSLSSANPVGDFPSQPKDVGQILSLGGEDGGGVIDDIKDATVAPGICAICGQLEPPGFDSEADDSELPVSVDLQVV